jgi:hypothetical protein
MTVSETKRNLQKNMHQLAHWVAEHVNGDLQGVRAATRNGDVGSRHRRGGQRPAALVAVRRNGSACVERAGRRAVARSAGRRVCGVAHEIAQNRRTRQVAEQRRIAERQLNHALCGVRLDLQLVHEGANRIRRAQRSG